MSSNLDKEMLTKGKEIYDKLVRFTRSNYKDDHIYYDKSYIKTPNGQHFTVDVRQLIPEVRYDDSVYDPKTGRPDGKSFFALYNEEDFQVAANVVSSNDDIFYRLSVSGDANYCYPAPMTAEHAKQIRECLDELLTYCDKLEYDTERTHVVDNLKSDKIRQRNRLIYNEEVAKLPKGETTLQCVKVAVEWWVDRLLEGTNKNNTPNQESVGIFRQYLYNHLMEELSTGSPHSLLSTDYNPYGLLRDALKEAGLLDYDLPDKTHMFIKLENVYVRTPYSNKGEEVLFSDPHEIDKYIHSEESLEDEMQL